MKPGSVSEKPTLAQLVFPRSDGLRLRGPRLRPAVLGHELVEFGLVLGMPQPVEKRLEFALFFFEPAQCFVAVLVKGAIAARTTKAPAGPLLRCGLHPFHPVLHPFHATLPAVTAAMCPTRHSSTPYKVAENYEAE